MSTDIPDLIAEAEETNDALVEAELANSDIFMMNKIHHVITIYPKISQSMLQMGIGPSVSSKMWRPVYDMMIKEKMLLETSVSAVAPTGRSHAYRVIEAGENFERAAVKH